MQYYHLHFTHLVDRLHIDLSILDHNHMRSKNFIESYREAYYRTVPQSAQFDNIDFHNLLELCLQIDVNLFYMKTCSCRQAQPHSTEL